MHRALRVPEILFLILGFLLVGEYPVLVNKQWAAVALRLCWRTTSDFGRLLNVLQLPRSAYRSKNHVRVSNQRWTVFEDYARLIRIVYVKPKHVNMSFVYDHIRTSVPIPVCRHLQELNWLARNDVDHCHLLMHHTVHTFRVHLPRTISCQGLFHDIYSKMSHLRHLEVEVVDRLGSESDAFVTLIRKLPLLESFILRRSRLSREMIDVLSQCPRLLNLESIYTFTEDDDQSFPLQVQPHSFRSLTSMSLTIRLQTLSDVLSTRCISTELKRVRVFSSPLIDLSNDSANETPLLQGFLVSLVAHSPRMECLHLNLLTHAVAYLENPPIGHMINFDALQPLTKCSRLREFSLTHDYPLLLSSDEVKHLLRSWPQLIYLSLNPHPPMMDPPPLTLDTVIIIGTLCRHIRHIGLNIDCGEDTFSKLPPLWTLHPLSSLRTLDIGISRLEGGGFALGAAAFLAHMCPNIASIDADVPWRGQLFRRRTEAVQWPMIPDVRGYISYVESEVNARSVEWVTASRHFAELICTAQLKRAQ